MYKNIIILLLFIGIICVVINLTKDEKECPKDRIIYRFIPRSLDEELDSPRQATDIYRTMFLQPDPWIKSIDNIVLRKREDINQFFISQF